MSSKIKGNTRAAGRFQRARGKNRKMKPAEREASRKFSGFSILTLENYCWSTL